MKKMKNISVGELVAYILSGLVALFGLTLAVLGIVARNLSDTSNALRTSEDGFTKVMSMNFSQFGALMIFVGAIIATITLVVVGKRVDVELEKRARRQQRMAFSKEEVTNKE